MATTVKQPFSIEQLAELPDDGREYEIIRGELRVVPPTNFEHSDIAGRIVTYLNMFVWRDQLGRVASEGAGYVLARDPVSLVAPDASFVSADRLPPANERAEFLKLSPDLAVEVMSPRDTVNDVAEKVAVYLQAGVRLVWVVLPKQRLVHVYVNEREVTILHEADTLDGGEVLPGFTLKVADIFG